MIPVLPAVFLLSPAIWRNVCPLATLGQGAPTPEAWSPLDGTRAPSLLPPLLALFAFIVLRATVLEESPVATAGLLAGVGAFAFWRGRSAPRKAGFCNRYCPILPVERLYGQSPLVEVPNARCDGGCDLCSPIGCIDLNPRSAVPQILGRRRHGHGWLTTPFGAFAAALPGLVLAFSRLPDVGSPALRVVVLIAGPVASWGVARLLVGGLDLGWRVAVPLFAASAAGIHLWTSIPGVLQAWNVDADPAPERWAAMLLVGVWWLRAQDSPRRARLVRLSVRRSEETPS